MLSASAKKRLRHVVLAGVVLSFVLLYMGPVTAGSTALTVAALAVAAAMCIGAALAF